MTEPIWIDVKEKLPKENEPFLAVTTGDRIEMMEWKKRIIAGIEKRWFGFYCPCSCCNGYCSDSFKYWMPIPLPPIKPRVTLWPVNEILDVDRTNAMLNSPFHDSESIKDLVDRIKNGNT